MANRNSKRAAKELSKEFAAERQAAHKIVNPPTKRRSGWKGHRIVRRPEVAA